MIVPNPPGVTGHCFRESGALLRDMDPTNGLGPCRCSLSVACPRVTALEKRGSVLILRGFMFAKSPTPEYL